MQDYLTQIPAGREGYIYLIHAAGTNRYKIGRSVNPIARMSDIQKQAPYPLRIIKSAWTLDAVADEATLHKRHESHRVFGEWFEFEKLANEEGSFWEARTSIVLPPIMFDLATQSLDDLGEELNLDFVDHPLLKKTMVNICLLYRVLRSIQQVYLTQEFFKEILPAIVKESLPQDGLIASDSKQIENFAYFINGTIATFKIMVLKKGGVA